MSGFVDCRCQKCHRRYGFAWTRGEPYQPCPHCKAKPPKSDSDALTKALEEPPPFPWKAIAGKRAHEMQGPALCACRIVAGLTGFQAATALGLEPMELMRLESGASPLAMTRSFELNEKIDSLYGLPRTLPLEEMP